MFQVIVIGDPNVGKTCLSFRYCNGRFPEKTEATIGVDFRERSMTLDDEFIRVSDTRAAFIFDTLENRTLSRYATTWNITFYSNQRCQKNSHDKSPYQLANVIDWEPRVWIFDLVKAKFHLNLDEFWLFLDRVLTKPLFDKYEYACFPKI